MYMKIFMTIWGFKVCNLWMLDFDSLMCRDHYYMRLYFRVKCNNVALSTCSSICLSIPTSLHSNTDSTNCLNLGRGYLSDLTNDRKQHCSGNLFEKIS